MEDEVVSRELIQRLYTSKWDPMAAERISSLLARVAGIDILVYHCHILFCDAVVPGQIPGYLRPLLESPKLTRFLLRGQLGIELPEESVSGMIQHDRDGTPEPEVAVKRARRDHKMLFLLLLRLEQDLHGMSEADPLFLGRLFDEMGDSEQEEVISQGDPTPLTIILSRRRVAVSNFYRFAALTTLGLRDAFEEAVRLSPRGIRRKIVSSAFPQVRELLPFFYRVYPELATYDRVVCRDRLRYFEDPTAIPLVPATLRTYVQVIEGEQSVASELFPGSARYGRENLKLFYAREILKTGDKRLLSGVVNCWLHESPHLAEGILTVGQPAADILVRSVPAVAAHFPLVLRLAKETRSPWYFELLSAMLRHSPQRGSAESVRDNLLYFDQAFISEFRELIDAPDR